MPERSYRKPLLISSGLQWKELVTSGTHLSKQCSLIIFSTLSIGRFLKEVI